MAKRILIADDAPFMRAMLRKILSGAGFEIAGKADNGKETVRLYDDLKPDLVTLDMVMPEMSGIDALQIIRSADPQAKLVVVSAVDQRDNLLEAIRSGATEYIVKPFDRDRVLAAVRRALGLAEADVG